jgi:MFS family permease
MVAVGALSLVVSVTVANWFIRHRGRALGVTWLGPRFGSAVLPALAQFFIITQGWRTAWTALGIIVFLFSGIPSVLFLRRKPEDVGLKPDGDDSDAGGLRGARGYETEAVGRATDTDAYEWTRSQAVHTPAFWMLTVDCSIAPFAQAGINFHIFPFLTDQGLTETTSVMILSTIAVFGAAGAVIWGFLAERFDVRNLLAGNGIVSGLVFFVLFVTVKNALFGSFGTGAIFLLAAVQGLLHGGRLPMLSLIWAEYYGRNALGSIYGFSSPFRFAANAVGPIFAALCFDFFGNYEVPFYLFVILFFVLGMICLSISRPKHP